MSYYDTEGSESLGYIVTKLIQHAESVCIVDSARPNHT